MLRLSHSLITLRCSSQLSQRFAAAGKDYPSLAVVEADENSVHGQGKNLKKLGTTAGLGSSSGGAGTWRTSRNASGRATQDQLERETRAKINARQKRHDLDGDEDDFTNDHDVFAGDEGLRRGILKGDKRSSTFLFPSSTIQHEEEEA